MVNPLAEWLALKGITQTELAAAADCDRGDVCRVVAGTMKANGRLRAFLADSAPDVLAGQDIYHESRKCAIRKLVKGR